MSAGTFNKLKALGLSLEQIGGVLEIIEEREKPYLEADAARKANARERVNKWRAKQPVTLHEHNRDATETAHASASPAPDLENKQTNKPERKQDSAPAARVGLADFRAELSSVLDPEHIEAICAVRRKKGATFSALAGRGLVKALRACPDATAAADEMVLRNWTGIKPDWLESRSSQRSTAPPAHQGDGYNAVLNKIINGQIDEHPGPTIDASYDRADSGGPTNLVQFNAISKGH